MAVLSQQRPDFKARKKRLGTHDFRTDIRDDLKQKRLDNCREQIMRLQDKTAIITGEVVVWEGQLRFCLPGKVLK